MSSHIVTSTTIPPAGDALLPSPTGYQAADLMYITWGDRQLALAYSPTLEEAKSTAAEDFELASHGIAVKDVGLFFQPNTDTTAPLVEVSASAWRQLRPLPPLYLVVRSPQQQRGQSSVFLQQYVVSQAAAPSTTVASTQQYQQQAYPQSVSQHHHLAFQRQPQRSLTSQASNLTSSAGSKNSSGKSKTKSKSNSAANAGAHANVDANGNKQSEAGGTTFSASASSGDAESGEEPVGMDIESWRHQGVHPYHEQLQLHHEVDGNESYEHQYAHGQLQQQQQYQQHIYYQQEATVQPHILLPHALPSPPLSDAQSYRTSSPACDATMHSDHKFDDATHYAGNHSQDNDVNRTLLEGHRVHFAAGNYETTSPEAYDYHQMSLAQQQQQQQQQQHHSYDSSSSHWTQQYHARPQAHTTRSSPTSPTSSNSPANHGFLADTGRRTTVHFPHTGGTIAQPPPLLAPTPLRRTQSQELLNADYSNYKLGLGVKASAQDTTRDGVHHSMMPQPLLQSSDIAHHNTASSAKAGSAMLGQPYNLHPPAKHLPRPSGLRHSSIANAGDVRETQDHSAASMAADKRKAKLANSRHLLPAQMPAQIQKMREHHVHRASSVSSFPSTPRVDSKAGLKRFSQQFASGLRPDGPLDLVSGETGLGQFTSHSSRRASLPMTAQSQLALKSKPSIPALAAAETLPAILPSLLNSLPSLKPPAPLIDVDMEDSDSSSNSSNDDDRDGLVLSQSDISPARGTRTSQSLRRLKSSPTGLRDQYRRDDIISSSPIARELSPPRPPEGLVSSSVKRGPTSWPNSPVKRNASLFSSIKGRHQRDVFATQAVPLPPLEQIQVGNGTEETVTGGDYSASHPSARPPLLPSGDLLPDFAVPGTTLGGTSLPGILNTPLSAFRLEQKRPDSPMPPLHRSSATAPQLLSTSNVPSAHVASKTKYLTTCKLSLPLSPPLTSTWSMEMPQMSKPRARTRSAQSADDVHGMISSESRPGPAHQVTPWLKPRSSLHLGSTTTKSRRARTS